MKMKLFYTLLLLPCVLLASDKSHLSPVQTTSISPIIKQATPAIVNITIQGEANLSGIDHKAESLPHLPHAQPQKFEGSGSGVIIDGTAGYIITNAHLIKQSTKITVNLNDGRKFTAKLMGADPATDIAVLQVPAKNLTQIKLGNSNNLEIGDFVVAIGNPFSLNRNYIGSNQTVTFGIISALNRANVLSEGYANFIQFDAAVNIGSSGGALINMNGELIGITTAFITPATAPLGNVGISFAIPINMAQSIVKQIIDHGSVKRGFVGIVAQNLTPELAKSFKLKNTQDGVVISQVSLNTPAYKADLKPGNIIVEINNEKITDANQVRNIIGLVRPGDSVKFTIMSKGNLKKVEILIEDLDEYQKTEKKNNPYLMKTVLEDITITSPTLGLLQGVLIQGTGEDTPLFEAGVMPGDIIVEVGDQNSIFPTHNMKELFLAIKKLTEDQKTNGESTVLLRIVRGPNSFYVAVKGE